MKAFDVKANGKIYDYRVGADLNLNEVKNFFEEKEYKIIKIWQEKRHVVSVLKKEKNEYFLKLSPTIGIGITTQVDQRWNDEINKQLSDSKFVIPRNYESGFYNKNLFYLIEDYFKGELLTKNAEYKKSINQIIELSELIQNLKIEALSENDNQNYLEYFIEKVNAWHNEIPEEIKVKYQTNTLFNLIKNNYKNLEIKTRHGDFAPWHMIKLKGNKIGLIDGEHAMKNGVEYYDIGYYIQRVFSVLEDTQSAKEILVNLKNKNYDLIKLKVILAARAIGGFCDETLIAEKTNFDRADKFKNWVISLN